MSRVAPSGFLILDLAILNGGNDKVIGDRGTLESAFDHVVIVGRNDQLILSRCDTGENVMQRIGLELVNRRRSSIHRSGRPDRG